VASLTKLGDEMTADESTGAGHNNEVACVQFAHQLSMVTGYRRRL